LITTHITHADEARRARLSNSAADRGSGGDTAKNGSPSSPPTFGGAKADGGRVVDQ